MARSTTTRAVVSVALAAVNGTTTRNDLAGQVCADVCTVSAKPIRPESSWNRR